jgi:hypothetical protein
MKTKDRHVRAAFAPCVHVQLANRASGTASPQGSVRASVAHGMAGGLVISGHTVRNRVKSIYRKRDRG